MSEMEALQAAKAELDTAIERRNYELRVFHKDSYQINRRIEQAKSDYITVLEARIREQDAALAAARSTLKPFADDYRWYLDWNKKNPKDVPDTYSEWLARRDPVSFADAVRNVYELEAAADTQADAEG